MLLFRAVNGSGYLLEDSGAVPPLTAGVVAAEAVDFTPFAVPTAFATRTARARELTALALVAGVGVVRSAFVLRAAAVVAGLVVPTDFAVDALNPVGCSMRVSEPPALRR
jgi:hypothetical protein